MPLLTGILALAVPLCAQVKVERGTDNPQSCYWENPKGSVERVFKRLLERSGYDGEHWLKKEGRGPTELVYLDKEQAIAGSPAVALAANTGPNKKSHAIVAATYGLLDVARDADELAFILGHEIAHLVLEHPQKMLADRMAAFDEWSAGQDWDSFPSNEAAVAAFDRDNKARFESFQRGLEREADQHGLDLAVLAEYDADGARRSMLHAKDWLWAQHQSETPTHDPLKARAARLMRLAKERDGLGGARALGESLKSR